MFALSVLALLLALSVLLTAAAIRWSSRRLGARRFSFRWALAATILLQALGVALAFASGWVESFFPAGEWFPVVVMAGAGICLCAVLLSRVMGTTKRRGALIWLSTLAAAVPVFLLLFVIKLHVLEAFALDANSMAPTLLGWHQEGVCPHCGRPAVASGPRPGQPKREEFGDRLGICTVCLRAGPFKEHSPAITGPDRILVDKSKVPQRWDVIAFRYPPEPTIIYVKRLVGLPGEEVVIKDGAVWVNGERQTPPEPLTALTYSPGEEFGGRGGDGAENQPRRLDDHEYFVLGDFSERSSDSRLWGPVPRSNLVGVVTVRYWPPSRWKVWK